MRIQTAKARIMGTGPYSQGKYVSQEEFPPTEEETSTKDWDKRIWKEKAHFDPSDQVVVPAMSLKLMMTEVTKRANKKIGAGHGAKKWAGIFKTSILVPYSPVLLQPDGTPWDRDSMTPEIVLTGPPGKKNELKFPTFKEWVADVEFTVLDPIITEGVFLDYLEKAGYLTGLGRFRIGLGWLYGGFTVESFSWDEGR